MLRRSCRDQRSRLSEERFSNQPLAKERSMPTYCLFQNLEITDKEKMLNYVESVEAVTKSFGGRYVTRGGRVEVKEGDWSPTWPVIIEFPSLEAANKWYDSQAYSQLKKLRQSAGRFSAVFIEGEST